MHRLNVTIISLIFVASGIVGLVISTKALPKYHFSFRAAKKIKSPRDRRDAARINRGILVREYIRLSIHILTTLTGVASFLVVPLPLPSHEPEANIWFSRAIILFLLWVTVATTINTCLMWMEYKLIRRRIPAHGFNAMSDLRRRIWRVEGLGTRSTRLRDTLTWLVLITRKSRRKSDASDGQTETTEERVTLIAPKESTPHDVRTTDPPS